MRRTVGGMRWCRDSQRLGRPGRRELGRQPLARANARTAGGSVGRAWWEPLSKTRSRARTLLQHPIQTVSHGLRTQQRRQVEHHLHVRQYRNARPQRGSKPLDFLLRVAWCQFCGVASHSLSLHPVSKDMRGERHIECPYLRLLLSRGRRKEECGHANIAEVWNRPCTEAATLQSY